MSQQKGRDLGSGSVGKLLITLSLPTITSQIVNMLYNLVDRVFIGHMQPAETVGKLALTGVGICFPVIMFISAFAALMAMGGAPKASIEAGRGNPQPLAGTADRNGGQGSGRPTRERIATSSVALLLHLAKTSIKR